MHERAQTQTHKFADMCRESLQQVQETVQLGKYCQNVTTKQPHHTVVYKKNCVRDKKVKRFRFFGFVFSFLGHPAGRENILLSPSCDGLPSSDCPNLSSLNV